ncbi:hypothetical protein GS938_21130 [Rhodococcus hoagii]|nr:hypothetical protein [Prescottella equi]NKW62297.1 hypothetical protein [Prescottella equi]
MFSTGSGGASSGANHAIGLGPTETMRAVFVLEQLSGGSSGATVIGFSKDAVGAAPAASFANGYGIGIPASSSAQVKRYNAGSTEDLGVASGSGQWIVTVTVDLTCASVVARPVDGSAEFRGRWDRAGINVNNLQIFMSDVRGTSGQAISKASMRRAVSTMSPRAGIEGIGASVHWSRLGTSGFRIALPKSYDSRVPTPTVVLFHGGGSDETHWADNANGRGVANTFLDAGYIVIGASHTSNRVTYGAQISLDAYAIAFEQAAKLYNLGPVVFYGNSMGGIESLLSLAQGRIPGVVAWIGSVPTASLEAAWDFTPGYLDRTVEIKAAYGIAGDGADYASKTAGHDPMLLDPKAFGGVPMYAVVATDDTSVHQARNWDVFAPRVAPYAQEMKRLDITGGHSSSQIAANAASMVEFAKKYAPI